MQSILGGIGTHLVKYAQEIVWVELELLVHLIWLFSFIYKLLARAS